MIPRRFPVLLVLGAIVAASCEITPTPIPVSAPGPVTFLSPQDGQVFQLDETILWRLEASSIGGLYGFAVTYCNTDSIRMYIMVSSVGSGGQQGNRYYGEKADGGAYTYYTGECTVRVWAEADDGLEGPSSEVTFTVAEPVTVDSIQMEILNPQQGDVLPLDTAGTLGLKATSFDEVARFEWTHCFIPGDTFTSVANAGAVGAEGTVYYGLQQLYPFFSSEAGPCTISARALVFGPEPQASAWETVHFSYGESLVEINPEVPPMLPPPTNTPASKSFQATARMNANCRAGPSTAHNEWGYALKDDVVEVVGRNEDGTWLNVLNPHGVGKCWLSIFALDVPFDVNGLPAVSYPTPPPSDEGGGQPPAAQGCLVVNAATGELMCVAPCPAGAAPERSCTP
jgi:hypothetical protein